MKLLLLWEIVTVWLIGNKTSSGLTNRTVPSPASRSSDRFWSSLACLQAEIDSTQSYCHCYFWVNCKSVQQPECKSSYNHATPDNTKLCPVSDSKDVQRPHMSSLKYLRYQMQIVNIIPEKWQKYTCIHAEPMFHKLWNVSSLSLVSLRHSSARITILRTPLKYKHKPMHTIKSKDK